ncbi:hypothetical protein RDABS01_033898 [Bienertia sinuspersici]
MLALSNSLEHGVSWRCMPDVVIYNTIIDSLCKAQLLSQALRVLAEMKSKGIPPNVITNTSLIRGMCTTGHWKEAEVYWTEMLQNDILLSIEATIC